MWLLAGPYEIAIASLALFAADAIAEHLGASWPKRAVLAAAGAVALWGVTLRFGHPEDAVAVGAVPVRPRWPWPESTNRAAGPAGSSGRRWRCSRSSCSRCRWCWWSSNRGGGPASWPGPLLPGALVLGIAAAANWPATIRAVTSQPNSAAVNHPTPWTALSAHQGGGMVAAGPARALAILAACGCAVAAGRRWGRRCGWASGARKRSPGCCGGSPWRSRSAPCSSR